MAFPRLIDATCDDIRRALDDGLFSSVDLVRAYLTRIEEVNGTVRAVTEVNPDACEIAGMLDEERARGIVRGPLHGIPILLKNNIATADNLNTTAGSTLLKGARVPRDSTTAARLRTAGAIILGKTNLTQWANYRSLNTPDGWSADGGQTLGAYHVNQDPSGSSSGSGVAVDLSLAAAAIGTETDGSIMGPAAKNGIVGIKPTVGLTSRDLVIPISEHQDSVGPMARCVRDAALLLGVLAGKDEFDRYTWEMGGVPDYVDACRDGLKGAKLGVPFHLLDRKEGLEVEIEEFKKALGVLKDCGAVVVDCEFGVSKKDIREKEFQVFAADFVPGLEKYLSQLVYNPSGIRTLQDVRDLTRQSEQEAYPDKNTDRWDEAFSQGWDNTDAEFGKVYSELMDMGNACLPRVLEEFELDAVVLPTTIAPVWAAVVGAPIITVPLGHYPCDAVVRMENGLVDTGPGVPFGLSFLGRRWGEERLIGLAYGFEERMRVREREVVRVVEPRGEVVRKG